MIRNIFILLISLLNILYVNCIDPCETGNHVMIDDFRRHVDYVVPQGKAALCDVYIRSGWYRFLINGSNAVIPTKCVQVYRCGTQAPIWLNVRGGLPLPGKEKIGQACAAWRLPRKEINCCMSKSTAIVKNCGDFYVYRISATRGCNLGYCTTVQERICEGGLILDPQTGNCLTPVTERSLINSCPDGQEYNMNRRRCVVTHVKLTKPKIQNVIYRSDHYLNCSLDLGNQSTVGVEFRIAWYKWMGGELQIIRRNMMGRLSLLKVYEDVFPGDHIQCGVSLMHVKTAAEDDGISDLFNLGFKFSEGTISLKESMPAINITLYTTIPILCDKINCGIDVTLAVLNLDGDPSSRIRLSACKLKVFDNECDENNVCGRAEIGVKVIPDFAFNEEVSGAVLSAIIGGNKHGWNEQYTEAMIEIEDAGVQECYIFADPHVQTFDGRLYDLSFHGTFVMFVSQIDNFVIHVRVWNCNGHGGYCLCGVAMSYRTGRINIDMCPGGDVRTQARSQELGGFKIEEALGGRIKYILFSGGSRLKVSIDTWGISLALMVNGLGPRSNTGLCGSFREKVYNNVHIKPLTGGTSFLALEWRIRRNKTLFDADYNGNWMPTFDTECDCSPSHDGEICGHSSPYLDNTISVLRTIDTTDQYLNVLGDEGSGDIDIVRDLDFKLTSFTKLKDTEPYQFEFDTEIKTFESGFPVPRRTEEENEVKPIWQRESLMKEADAQFLCASYIVDSPISVACTSIVQQSVDTALNLCLQDIQIKKNSSRVKYDLKIVEDMCENSILKDFISYVPPNDFDPVFPLEVQKSLACPSGCNGRGQCTVKGCVCESFYFGLDCSVLVTTTTTTTTTTTPTPTTTTTQTTTTPTTETATTTTPTPFTDFFTFPPETTTNVFQKVFPLPEPTEISVIKWNKTFELCDINLYGCDRVTFFVPKRNSGFKCKLTLVEYSSDLSNLSMSIGIDLKANEVDCIIPSTKFLRRVFSQSNTERYQIEVMNRRGRVVSDRRFVVYDSRCRHCKQGSPCVTKENTCYIDGKCYPMQARNIQNRCQQCIPTVSNYKWTGLEENQPPVFEVTNKQVVRFLEEEVKVLILAYDPEGSETTLTVHHKDAIITEGNILVWNTAAVERKETPKLELFEVTASDPCNASSVLLIQLIVVSCDCLHNGICANGFDSISGPFEYTCSCLPGYTGKLCEVDINDCEPNPCLHGTCIDQLLAYECVCPQGYKGDKCEISTDLCNTDPCFPGVLCLTTPGSFTCSTCPPGLTGDGITCTETDSCLSSPCFPGTSCKDLTAPNNGYVCGKCPRFFIGDGEQCKRNSEKACKLGVCSDLVTCMELRDYPGYSCSPCPKGYSGNGTTCTPICEPSCGRYRTCYEPNKCKCPDGYAGHRCHKAICDPKCHKGGFCTKPNVCKCFSGYKGILCEISTCQPSCKNDGKCYSSNRCRCKPGYGGSRCERVACGFKCFNGGRCIAVNKCKCRPGFYGIFCERKICRPSCLNGGHCTSAGTCRCPTGYFGKRCQNAICSPPCVHGGKCKRKNTCKCPRGYGGPRCENAICRQGCRNGGRCRAPDRCMCRSGWRGFKCDKAICDVSCKNSGLCFKPNICACKDGYAGSDCSKPICRPSCKNKGFCMAPGYCWCNRNHYGKDCSKRR